jgi:hypothetical protein
MHIRLPFRVSARRSAGLLIAAVLLGVPAVALANHDFPDVTNSNPFHDDISAIAHAGITSGFGDGNYHPADPITRQAMAAFMHRGLSSVSISVGTTLPGSNIILPPAMALSTSLQAVRSLTITVPGSNNAFMPSQKVHLVGRVAFNASMTTNAMTQGCPCEFTALIRDMATMAASTSQTQTFESTSSTAFGYSFDAEAVFVAEPGSRTYQLEVQLSNRATGTAMSVFGLDQKTSLSATTYPFGN